jgi:hypothetical protein
LVEWLSVETPDLAKKKRFLLRLSTMKAIALGVFALALLGGSSCTKVHVEVHAPASDSRLTGTGCKLLRELRNHQQKTDYWCWAAAAQTVIEYVKQESLNQCDLVQAVFGRDLVSATPPIDQTGDQASISIDADGNPIVVSLSPPTPHCCMVDEKKFIRPDDPWYIQKAAEACWKNGRADMVFDSPEFGMNYKKHDYDWDYPGPQGLPWEEIVTEICEDRPIVSTIAHDVSVGGGAHAVVIGGYKELGDGSRWMQVYDPGYSTIGDSYVWLYEVYLGDPGVFTHVRDYTSISARH